MRERFASARLAQSNAQTVIKRMQRNGLVSLVEGDEGRPAARIEATKRGHAKFDSWLRASWNNLPELRDPTLIRLALCRDIADLRMMGEVIAREEELCDSAQLDARTRANVKQERLSRHAKSGYDWRTDVECTLLIDEAAFWTHRARRLHRLGEALKDILDRMEESGEGTRDG